MTTPSPEVDEVPVSTEPVTAWRVWHLERTRRGLVLSSVAQDTRWTRRKPTRAKCSLSQHRPADPSCRCGLYAVPSAEALVDGAGGYRAPVIGTVSLWGRITEHTAGFRAEYGYPQRLRLACQRCLTLGKLSEPVWVIETSGSFDVMCAGHAALREGGTSAADLQAELLDTYAVELLPMPELPKRLRRPARSPSARRANPLETVVGVILGIIGFVFQGVMALLILGWVLSIAGWIVMGGLRLIGVVDPPAEPTPTPITVEAEPMAFVPVEPGLSPPGSLRRVQGEPDAPRLAFICGEPSGVRIVQVPCDADAPMFGIADDWMEQPTRDVCPRSSVSFSRTPRWHVCWYARKGAHPDVPLHTRTANPFTGGDDGDR